MEKYKNSEIAHTDQLSLFNYPKTNEAVENVKFVDYLPTSQLNYDQSIRFSITSSSFLDLSQTKLKVKLKIVQGPTGANLAPWPDMETKLSEDPDPGFQVGPVRNLFHSLFSHIDCSISKTNTSNAITSYPYKAFFDMVLSGRETPEWTNIGFDIRDTQFEDTPYLELPELVSKIDPTVSADQKAKYDIQKTRFDIINQRAKNEGLTKRSKQYAESREITLQGKLLLDCFEIKQYLLHNCSLELIFYPSKPSFTLMTPFKGSDFKVEILECSLTLCEVTLNPAVTLGIQNVHKTQPIVYPVQRSVVKSYSIPQGSRSHTLDNIFDKAPDYIICAFVAADAATGNFSRNPYSFKPFGLSEIGLYLSNSPHPCAPYKLRYANTMEDSDFMDGFSSIYKYNPQLDITKEEYHDRLCIYVFDLSQKSGSDLYPIKKTGNIKLSMEFDRSLSESINMIIYSKESAIYTLDSGYVFSVSQ